MEFDDLTYYGVLAEELNFPRAAARLGISQSSLTRRIRRLEREIGTYLVERHSRRIRLTAAGEIFAERAAWIADELARLKLELADAGRGVLGRLAVGFLTSLSSDVFRRVLRVFASNRDLRLELREGTARQQLVALRQHRIDLALTFGPIDDPELNTESLWSERLTAVAPADHPVVVGKAPNLARPNRRAADRAGFGTRSFCRRLRLRSSCRRWLPSTHHRIPDDP